MAHGAPHDPPQHIAAAFVRRQHAIGDEEGRSAQMIGDDAVAGLLRPVGIDTRRRGNGEDQGAQEIYVIVRLDALQQSRDALEPHARIDRRPRQGDALARRNLFELHEDEVPELEETVALLIRAAGRPAGERLALIVEDFRAGAARPGVAHGPEIVRGRNPDDLPVRETGDLFPKPESLVVVVIDGDEEPVFRQAEDLRDQAPGELDRVGLEIVAEGKIAEHLKECVMACCIADIVEVIVLAAGPDAFLRRGGSAVGPLLDAGEDILELDHAGIGEQQGRIIAWHERRGGDDRMPVAGEIIEESGPDLVDARHCDTSRRRILVRAAALALAIGRRRPFLRANRETSLLTAGLCPVERRRRNEFSGKGCGLVRK